MNELLQSAALAWSLPIIALTVVAGLTELAEWVWGHGTGIKQ